MSSVHNLGQQGGCVGCVGSVLAMYALPVKDDFSGLQWTASARDGD